MASIVPFVQWRLTYFCASVIILQGVCIDIVFSNHDLSYYSYDTLHASEDIHTTIELKDTRLTKRSVLYSQLQPATNVRDTSLTNQSIELTPSKPDVEVSKASNLSNVTSSKTGGNYLSDNSTVVIADGKPDTYLNNKTATAVTKAEKWLGAVGKLRKKVNEEVAEMVGNSTADGTSTTDATIAPIPGSDNNSTAKTAENSKGDGKPTKKAESETKPPKLAPTKSPLGDDKAAKKSAAEEKASKSEEATSTTTQPAQPIPSVASSTETAADPDDQLNFPHDVSNKTLLQNNITSADEDHHQYYNSSFVVNNAAVGLSHWVNMSDRHDVFVNELLSQSHRRAATVRLSFDFPFYGHLVRNLTIATGGFLYTGDYVHSWLAATQYIAPLMANFDTSLSKDSYVKYVDNGTAFTVQWEKVVLQDRPAAGDFTFQVTLHSDGDIVFVYKTVPVVIEHILDDHHPVKVGLSDAYIIDRTIFFVRRKTIYEYHRVNFERQDIKNWTVIYLNALPTCLDVRDCSECLNRATGFACNWCPGANRCSNGMDRHRQEWLQKGCDRTSVSNSAQCLPSEETPDPAHAHSDKHSLSEREDQKGVGMSGIIGILFVVAFIAGLGIWVIYSYRNPHTAAGQFLIRYRPSTWGWRRGQARYTAATIHM